MTILEEWINPIYLDPDNFNDIRESALAKPHMKYAVLDHFFLEEKLDELIEQHKTLKFSEKNDKFDHQGKRIPYDSEVVFATKDHVGGDLLFDPAWHQFCADLVGVTRRSFHPVTKLRWHRPHADGFWVHEDGARNRMATIAYFNKDWTHKDGGLLQLWKELPYSQASTPSINQPKGRFSFLSSMKLIRTHSPGGGFDDKKDHDMLLIDQIVPAYNRVFFCNFENVQAFHAVTPSYARERTGFVQWLQ